MRIENGIVKLANAKSILPPDGNTIGYRDEFGTQIIIPLSAVLRMYEVAKTETERRGLNWDAQCELICGA